MSDKLRCTCRRCTIRSLMGPAIITTIGILFLLSEFADHSFGFGRTFPVVLIVIGAILLASSLAPNEGHIDPSAPPPPAAPPTGPYQGPQGQGQ
jgi:hypothetical protein